MTDQSTIIADEDELLTDFIAEARAHAGDMPPVIQRDYLNTAIDKLEALAPINHRISTLYDAIAHGDDEHRAWLQEAISNHFAGLPVPEPRGKGTGDDYSTTAESGI